jgi:TonB family protein
MRRILFLVFISLLANSCLIQAQDKKINGYSVDSSVIVLPKFTPDEKQRADLIEYKNYDLKVDTTDIYDVVEQMPQFPGGEEALMKYIQEDIHYPTIAFKNGVQGRVICHFVVNRKGEIGQIEVLRSLDPSCDKESVRVIKTLPRFVPAKQKGVNVNVWYTLPVISICHKLVYINNLFNFVLIWDE